MKTKHIAVASIGIVVLTSQAIAEVVRFEKISYDAAGNTAKKLINSLSIINNDEQSSNNSKNHETSYLKDAAGRVLGESRNGRLERKFFYQFGDKITKVEKDGDTTKLFYNSEGRLVGKVNAGTCEAFAWDGNGLAVRGDTVFTNERHAAGGVPALSNEEVMVTDHLASSLSIGGKSFEFTACGQGLEEGFFTGKPYVKELDCYVFPWRNYSAKFSMWLTSDPTGYPDGIDNQEYAKNDPVNNIDPLGLTVQPWPGNGVVWNHTDCSGAGDKVYFDGDGWHVTTTTGGPPTTSTTYTTYETSMYLSSLQFHNPPYVIVTAVGTGMDMHWCSVGDSSYTAKVTDADNFHYVGPKAGTPSYECGANPITPLPKYIGASTLSVFEM